MAARAKERLDALTEVARVNREAYWAARREEALRNLSPPPCKLCYTIGWNWGMLDIPMWMHDSNAETLNAEGDRMWMCTCTCHPQPEIWGPMVALA